MPVQTKAELRAAEDAGWAELLSVIESLSPELLQEPGYFPEGWSVKDMIWHIGSWQAEAQCVLEQLRMGTYVNRPIDVDGMNQRFLEANRELPLAIVRAEAWSARTRMLIEMNLQAEVSTTAEEWFVESGAEHYAEHLPRLREWADELRAR
jgi:hypothetical protein